MQSSSERIFVYLIVLAGMALLSLFLIYFDVSEMFVAITGREEKPLSTEDSRRLQELAENAHRRALEAPKDLAPRPQGPDSDLSAEEEAWYFGRFVPEPQYLVKAKEEQLRGLGYADPAFLRMESLAMDQDGFMQAKKEVASLYGEGKLRQAAAVIEAAIQKEDPENMLVLKEHYLVLLAISYEIPDMAKAGAAFEQLKAVMDRIVALKRQGLEDRASDLLSGEVVALEHEKLRLEKVQADAVRRAGSMGRPGALTPGEKEQMRRMLDEALVAKALSPEDHAKALEELMR